MDNKKNPWCGAHGCLCNPVLLIPNQRILVHRILQLAALFFQGIHDRIDGAFLDQHGGHEVDEDDDKALVADLLAVLALADALSKNSCARAF